MASVKHAISEHDLVELSEPVEGWPAGTVGTVVGDYGEVKLIEVSSPKSPGTMLDLVRVPESAIELRSRRAS